MINSASSFCPFTWASLEFKHCNFNDARLTQRCIKIAGTMLQNHHESIPNAFAVWPDIKGTYRFFDNKKVVSKSIMSSHYKETLLRSNKEDTLLVLQDTTTINLSNRQIDGVGRIGMGTLQGFFIHSALATDTKGTPVGLLDQTIYVRKESTTDPLRQKIRKKLPIEEKETFRWKSSIEHVSSLAKNTNLVFVGDRESDIYDVFEIAHTRHVHVLVRTAWNRNDPQGDKLFDQAKNAEILGTYTTQVPVKNTHDVRSATLTIRRCIFELIPSKVTGKKRPPIKLSILDVLEENPPENAEQIHWLLSTSLVVNTIEEAKEKVTWYMYRWRIERFHYILKTGAFEIEKMQFEQFTRWEKVVSLFSVIAWKILWILYESREEPDKKANSIFSRDEITILCAFNKKGQNTYTLGEATIDMAKLGGFIGRKSDGSPGVKTLWRGFQKLQFLVMGYKLASRKDVGKD